MIYLHFSIYPAWHRRADQQSLIGAEAKQGPSGDPCLMQRAILSGFVVLPHRIELWTSPLPRGCSTTELRQQNRETAPVKGRGRTGAGTLCHKALGGARKEVFATP